MRTTIFWSFLLLSCGGQDGGPTGDKGSSQEGTDTEVLGDTDLATPQGDCIDGEWREASVDPSADISAALGGFNQNNPAQFLIGALEARYPIGAHILERGLQATRLGDCVEFFTTPADRRSPERMVRSASTLVHECGHFLDIESGGFSGAAYVITDSKSLVCQGGSFNSTPARSLLQTDDYAALRPACPASGSHGCDNYANIYLDGDPTDGSFESGDQGFDMLMEETLQYVNSLATDYAFYDQYGAGSAVSARDGILTFLWYTERYLRLARTEYPNAYDALMADACWRDLVLTVWGRAWKHLDDTEGISQLGIDDDVLMELVLEPELLQEIQRVRDAEGC